MNFAQIRQKAWKIVSNRYTAVIAFMVVWMVFFDRNNLFTQLSLRKKLGDLYNDKKYYQKRIKEYDSTMKQINENQTFLEQYAREKYWMKRDNEDVFIIVSPEEVASKKEKVEQP